MVKCTGEEHILTIKEVASYLKVTERTIYWLSQAKKIPVFALRGASEQADTVRLLRPCYATYELSSCWRRSKTDAVQLWVTMPS
ncbi:MAG: hypothetical protein CK528_06875 [Alcaligenaceae bacterium]|nr:MAG: hypothetical protein CK528_06875 [Alcaligenaceae bacterium]